MARKIKTISFTEEEQLELDAICKDTGMKEAEVIRQLIHKAFTDKKTREIITRESWWQKQKGGKGRTSSYNVHCVNEKKADSDHTESAAVSLNCQQHNTEYTEELQRVIDKAKENLLRDLDR